MTAPAERTRCQLVGLRDRMIAHASAATVTTEAGYSEIGLARAHSSPTPRGGRLNLEPSCIMAV
jgi:hypothetical protein